jgi:predicted P-loop ATPase
VKTNIVKKKVVSLKTAPRWPDGVNSTSGLPKSTYGNVLAAITHMEITVQYDIFRGKMMVAGIDLTGEGEVSDHVVSMLRHLIYDKYGFHPNESITREAITVMGRQHQFNSVSDWLTGLEWDRTPRVDTMLSTYLGAKNNKFNRAISRKMLCAMVRRAQVPGTKFDHMVILEGDQDLGKSRFCSDLAGGAELFNDTPVLNKEPKAQMEAVEGKWVVEIAELQGMRKAEIEKVKAFVSRTCDRERKAYAHFRAEVPRTCVFIGTTNAEFYLKDVTGNRRFWPVKVERYDHGAFMRDRDQIFAEAVVLERDEKLWLDDDNLRELAASAQEKRMEPNPYTEKLKTLYGEEVHGEERIFAKDVWRHLGIDTLQSVNAGEIMHRLAGEKIHQ